MAHPGRNNIYEAIIKRMVAQALEAQEQESTLHRSADSDVPLCGYFEAHAMAPCDRGWQA